MEVDRKVLLQLAKREPCRLRDARALRRATGTLGKSHTYRSWRDALGSPIGLQQRMMPYSSITTTANYRDTVASDLRQAHEKVVQRAFQHGNGTEGSTTH